MKKLLGVLLAVGLMALPFQIQGQTNYTAQSGVTFFVQQAATATATSGAVRLPTFSGAGTLTVVETGITGSPSGCTVKLYYQSNGGGANTSVVSTTTFTPSTGVQTFAIAPSVASGDNYVAVYACSSTYPMAGALTASFSPITTTITGGGTQTVSQANVAGATNPCQNPAVAKSSAAIAITSATTTQLVGLVAGKKVYVCDMFATTVGTSASVLLTSGTGSACGTPDAALTGAMVPSATVGVIHLGYGGTVAVTPTAGDELCLTSGATVTSVEGVLSYVQQ